MPWWDVMGGMGGEYRGQFDVNVLTLGAPMLQGGHSRTSWTLTGADGHTFLMEVSPDGETWHPAMEGRYRKGAPRKAAKKKATAKRVGAKPAGKGVKKVVKKPAKKAAKRAKAAPKRNS